VIRSRILCVAPGDELEPVACDAATGILGVDEPIGHPDFEVFRPDGNIFRVALVEELVFRSVLAPVAGSHRVFAVLEPERMSGAAANLLLKTLEEPPPSLHMLFVTRRLFDLPATIRSRCAVTVIAPGDRESLLLSAGIEPSEARRLAFLAGTCQRATRLASEESARQLLDAWVRHPGAVSGLPSACLALPRAIDDAISSQPSGDEEDRRRQRRERTDDVLAGLSVWGWLYREVLARALGARLVDPAVEADPKAPMASLLAKSLGIEGALSALSHLNTAREAILANGSVRLALEALCLRLGALSDLPSALPPE
jgi:DNA polymerase-3 subunit delta'